MNNLRSGLKTSHNKPLPLAELAANDLKRNHGYLKVETQGLTYDIKFKPSDRVYSARGEDGEYFENVNFAELKKELKRDATPFISCAVAFDGQVVGHIMNQNNLFFFRPANSKGELDTEKLYDPDDVLESLNAKSAGTYTKSD